MVGPSLSSNNTYERTYQYGQSRRNDFIKALLILIAAVIKVDGSIKRSELDFVKSRLLALLGHDEAQRAILALRDILKRDYNIYQVCNVISNIIDYDSKLEILHILYGIAAADGFVCDSEIVLIRQIAYNIGVNQADAESIFSMVAGRDTEADAYKVLEISPQATDEEVKKAYRTMAMKYHPDRVAELGDDVQKNAATRFRKVQDAYEKIKLARGIK